MLLTKNKTLQEWYEVFGHQNKRHVNQFLKNKGVNVKYEDGSCETCVLEKHCRMTFGKRIEKSLKAGELIFADICNKYFLAFKDDFTSFRKVYLTNFT